MPLRIRSAVTNLSCRWKSRRNLIRLRRKNFKSRNYWTLRSVRSWNEKPKPKKESCCDRSKGNLTATRIENGKRKTNCNSSSEWRPATSKWWNWEWISLWLTPFPNNSNSKRKISSVNNPSSKLKRSAESRKNSKSSISHSSSNSNRLLLLSRGMVSENELLHKLNSLTQAPLLWLK